MLILAFDTALAACSVAVWRDGATLAAARTAMDRGQAEALIPMIDAVLNEARSPIETLDRIAVTVGPGSFTGVRVGLATARGLGLALARPVIGVTTGEALAAAARRLTAEASIVAATDTKRGDLYVELFTPALVRAAEPIVLAVDQVRDWLKDHGIDSYVVVGDGAERLGTVAFGQCRLPDAAVLAALAAEREPLAGGPLALYVRPPDVGFPRER